MRDRWRRGDALLWHAAGFLICLAGTALLIWILN